MNGFDTDSFALLSPGDQRTVIGHASHDIMSPLSEETVAMIIERIGFAQGVLDVGGGKGAFARRAVKSGRVESALCIEQNAVLAAEGRRLAEQQGVGKSLHWVVGDVADWRPLGSFDVLAVIGSSQALGGLNRALAFAADQLRPGGRLVLGEGIWHAPPPLEYLRFLGTDGSETPTPETLATAIEATGFRIEHVHRSTTDEWAAYEDPYFAALCKFTSSDGLRPYAAQAQVFAKMQARYGRAALGFETAVAVRV